MAAPASDVDAVYIAAGANRHSAVADWGWDGTVAYGADANIALWRPRVRTRVARTSSGASISYRYTQLGTMLMFSVKPKKKKKNRMIDLEASQGF